MKLMQLCLYTTNLTYNRKVFMDELTIGTNTCSKHKNTILIGDGIESKAQGHVLIKFGDHVICDKVLTEEELKAHDAWSSKFQSSLRGNWTPAMPSELWHPLFRFYIDNNICESDADAVEDWVEEAMNFANNMNQGDNS